MLALGCACSTALLAGCKKDKDPEEQQVFYSFSCAIKSGRSVFEVGQTDFLSVYDNGVDTAGRTYVYSSTNDDVASIDSTGKITAKAPGTVNFKVREEKSGDVKQLANRVVVVGAAQAANGGFNFAGAGTDADLDERAKILGQLEKYAMDTHLSGITLFDNGGFAKYSERVTMPTTGGKYVTGYGFGIITEGSLTGTLPAGSTTWPDYYHTNLSQDSLKIDQYSATGSQVSDLASYITSTYWGTKLDPRDHSQYVWYPVLAKDTVRKPIIDGEGNIVDYEATESPNNRPIPIEKANGLGMYRKWRIYVKTSELKYHTTSAALQAKGFDGRAVTIDDYEFIYKYLLTGSNALTRGTEMANDSSYGIKGAQRFNNNTRTETDITKIDKTWTELKTAGKLGIETGKDINGDYIDLELINAIDDFTAMYVLSSSLVSPMPRDYKKNEKAIAGTMKDAADKYGKFNNGDIHDYTLCCGPFVLEQWDKNQDIVFKRCDDWFEVGPDRYKIPGIYYRVIDVSTDLNKTWKEFNAGKLDSAGIPTDELPNQKGQERVFESEGDSTFKLNVNTCTQEQWDKINNDHWHNTTTYQVKPWMSNHNFVNGLFYSIDRKSFAGKRGVSPSINYFSNSYMANPQKGISYNSTQYHKDAVAGYETFDSNGESDYGYNLDKAIDCFRAAVKELTAAGKLTLQTRENPAEVKVNIIWMYQTDIKEYGEDISSYFERAFNNDAVCGGRAKLVVEQDAVTNWEDVYSKYLQKGNFDLGFGAISGNSYNPLNFMEVLKSDDSSGFTLNWGNDTSKIDPVHPIIYDENPNDSIPAKKYSFDGLWEVADHGGIVNAGEKVKPINNCSVVRHTKLDGSGNENNLYNGYKVTINLDFVDFAGADAETVQFKFKRLELYVAGYGPYVLSENSSDYKPETNTLTVTVSAELADEINNQIILTNHFDEIVDDPVAWHKNPFYIMQLGPDGLFSYELYYSIQIGTGSESENYAEVLMSNE